MVTFHDAEKAMDIFMKNYHTSEVRSVGLTTKFSEWVVMVSLSGKKMNYPVDIKGVQVIYHECVDEAVAT